MVCFTCQLCEGKKSSVKVRKAKDDAVVGYTLPRAARNVEPSPVSFKLVKIGNRKVMPLG